MRCCESNDRLTCKEGPGRQPGMDKSALAGFMEAGSIVVATIRDTIFIPWFNCCETNQTQNFNVKKKKEVLLLPRDSIIHKMGQEYKDFFKNSRKQFHSPGFKNNVSSISKYAHRFIFVGSFNIINFVQSSNL